MAAIFYSPTQQPGTIFRSGVQVNTAIRVPFLDDLINSSGFAVITDVSVNNQDTVQFFMTFDDFISYFYFGKGLGDLTIRGNMFMDCSSNMPGLNRFYDKIADIRGTEVDVSCGNAVFTCVLVGFSTTTTAEPTNITEFTLQLRIIDHSLGRKNFNASC